MAERHGIENPEEISQRESDDQDAMVGGDSPLDQEPPNVTEAEPAPGTSDDEARQIESDLDSLQRDLAVASDRYLRLAAEFDNYRKRVDRERVDSRVRAQSELAGRLLDTLDDLERVVQYADASTADALLQGVQLVERKLRQTLESAGLETIDADGAPFDPNSMEAVAMVATDSIEEDDTVSDVFQRGYSFQGTLLRPARVRVKKHGI
jgi:molecular chaperone GrpE